MLPWCEHVGQWKNLGKLPVGLLPPAAIICIATTFSGIRCMLQ